MTHRNILSLFFVLLLSYTIIGCEKKSDVVNTSENSTNSNYKPSVEKKYRSATCQVNGKDGTKCVVGAWSSSTCTKATDCKASDDGILNSSFTPDELSSWADGSYNFEYTVEYINEHYDYFKYLYENDLSYHPDTVIMILNGE